MADLFTLPELAAYMQQPSVNTETAELLLELATGLIEDVYGDALPDPAPARLKRVALEVVKRAYLNPYGYRSESLGDYSYTRTAPQSRDSTASGLFLTDAERAVVVSAAGRSTVRSVRLVTPYEFTGDDVLDSWT